MPSAKELLCLKEIVDQVEAADIHRLARYLKVGKQPVKDPMVTKSIGGIRGAELLPGLAKLVGKVAKAASTKISSHAQVGKAVGVVREAVEAMHEFEQALNDSTTPENLAEKLLRQEVQLLKEDAIQWALIVRKETAELAEKAILDANTVSSEPALDEQQILNMDSIDEKKLLQLTNTSDAKKLKRLWAEVQRYTDSLAEANDKFNLTFEDLPPEKLKEDTMSMMDNVMSKVVTMIAIQTMFKPLKQNEKRHDLLQKVKTEWVDKAALNPKLKMMFDAKFNSESP